MLGIDTNVLLRLVVTDDAEQTRRAHKLVEASLELDEPVFISLLVLVESEWVLRSRYGFKPGDIRGIFRSLLESSEMSFEDEPAVEEALFRWQSSGCEFADCLIVAHNRRLGCRTTSTFDHKAAKLPGAAIVRS